MNLNYEFEEINELDLQDVLTTFSRRYPEYGLDLCNDISILYKSFLFLKRKYPNRLIIPNKQIDNFWHEHILHTEKYRNDCSKIFGKYLDHTPCINESELKENTKAFSETLVLVKKHFPELF